MCRPSKSSGWMEKSDHFCLAKCKKYPDWRKDGPPPQMFGRKKFSTRRNYRYFCRSIVNHEKPQPDDIPNTTLGHFDFLKLVRKCENLHWVVVLSCNSERFYFDSLSEIKFKVNSYGMTRITPPTEWSVAARQHSMWERKGRTFGDFGKIINTCFRSAQCLWNKVRYLLIFL